MMSGQLLCVVFTIYISLCIALINLPIRIQRTRSQLALQHDAGNGIDSSSTKKFIIVEVSSKKRLHFPRIETEDTSNIVAYNSVYKEAKEDKLSVVLDSPVMKVAEILFNPITLCLAIYFSSFGWSRLIWLQKILKIFGKGTLSNKPKKSDSTTGKLVDDTPSVSDAEIPYQIFECDVCGMEMRPARGRAEIVFGRDRFRCARCGSKASSYFNIDDMNDPRAVARKERIIREKAEEEGDDGDDGDDQ